MRDIRRDINGQKRDTERKNVTRDTSRARNGFCHGVTLQKRDIKRDMRDATLMVITSALTCRRALGRASRHGLWQGRESL
jgi:hypothetical protein